MTKDGVINLGIHLNGAPASTGARTLAELLAELEFPAEVRVATAINGRFVPERERATTGLAPGDEVEIVSPRQGG